MPWADGTDCSPGKVSETCDLVLNDEWLFFFFFLKQTLFKKILTLRFLIFCCEIPTSGLCIDIAARSIFILFSSSSLRYFSQKSIKAQAESEELPVLPVPVAFHSHPSSPLPPIAAALQTRPVHHQRERRHPPGRDVGSLESLRHLFADVRRRHQDRHAGMQPACVSRPSLCSHAGLSLHPSCRSQCSADQPCTPRHPSRL